VLREHAYEKGIRPKQRVITYCGVGISASQGLFALYLAGYRNLALYDASWEEWGTDRKYPVEREE
jgi:thiosulfate/3-mercaptopyruvate sulfurtransferase